MVKEYYIWILILLSTIMVHSCLDEIDLNIDSAESILVVDGAIYLGEGPHTVKLKKSASFVSGAEGVETPVSGATVTISELGGSSVILTETEDGTYATSGLIGSTGKEYQLFVEVNGEVYESKVELMPNMVSIDELDWNLKDETILNAAGNLVSRRIVELEVNSDFSQFTDPTFLRYRIFGTYEYRELGSQGNLNPLTCFIEEVIDTDNIITVDGREIQNGALNSQIIIEKEVDYRFAYKYCFTVLQQSISQNSFDFWKTIEDEYNRTGDIFETPPAVIRGNIFNAQEAKSDVIGLFSAIALDTSRLFLIDTDIRQPPRDCFGFRNNNPPRCFNCLAIQNSSLTKPPCFE